LMSATNGFNAIPEVLQLALDLSSILNSDVPNDI